MQIVVKNPKKSPTLMTLEVESSNTIDDLKSQIYDNLCVHVDELRLVYRSKQLSDKLTVGDYNIHKDAVIYVVFRIRGGIQNFINTLLLFLS
jgi:ubiquitin C